MARTSAARGTLRTAASAHGYRSLRPGVPACPRDTSSAFLPALTVPGLATGWLPVELVETRSALEHLDGRQGS